LNEKSSVKNGTIMIIKIEFIFKKLKKKFWKRDRELMKVQ